MVDTSLLNQSIDTGSKGVTYYLSAIPKYLTENITNLLRDFGFSSITEGWSRILLYTISLALIFIALKISKPIIKYLLLMLCLILILGFWVPF